MVDVQEERLDPADPVDRSLPPAKDDLGLSVAFTVDIALGERFEVLDEHLGLVDVERRAYLLDRQRGSAAIPDALEPEQQVARVTRAQAGEQLQRAGLVLDLLLHGGLAQELDGPDDGERTDQQVEQARAQGSVDLLDLGRGEEEPDRMLGALDLIEEQVTRPFVKTCASSKNRMRYRIPGTGR